MAPDVCFSLKHSGRLSSDSPKDVTLSTPPAERNCGKRLEKVSANISNYHNTEVPQSPFKVGEMN